MGVYLRNLASGDIKQVDSDSPEFAKLKAARTDDGRFPLYEQTGAHDADPKGFASEFEYERRNRYDGPAHDVTSDGVPKSDAGVDRLGSGTDKPTGKTNAKA